MSKVAVFAPHPLRSITIENRGSEGDDIHLHGAGQGVWVARMAAELNADRDAMPDLDVLAEGIEESFAELREAARASSEAPR